MAAAGLGQGQGPGSVPESKLREAVMAAVDSGASVNAVNDNGQTALHGAAGQGFDTIIQLLADRGADLNVKDKRGQSALTSVLRRSTSPRRTIDLLLKLGAQPDSDRPDPTPSAPPAAFATESGRGVQSLTIDNVHLRVADPREAAAWYVKYFGATAAPDPGQVLFGKTLIAFVKTGAMQPSAGSVIDHIALSYADLDAAMRVLVGSGAKVVSAPADNPGLFKAALVEDPWGVQIEVLQDADLPGFHHVHLRVPRPDATLAWFESLLGGTKDKLKGRVEGLRYGRVWLLAAPSGTAAPEPSALRAIQNIAWQIPDINRAADAFQRAGVKTIIQPRALRDLWYAFFEDPNGIRVELIQRPPQ
jgi:catechol 2,3-dioxygenase-like lactoylglutathione lyase family enzyme